MSNGKDKIKANLERKIELVNVGRHTRLYYDAVLDYHFYLGKTAELGSILRGLILSGKIPADYLQSIFTDFLVSSSVHNDSDTPSLPHFYNEDIESKYNLKEKALALFESEVEEIKNNTGDDFFNPNAPIKKLVRDEDFFNIQKLHNNIMERLDRDDEYEAPVFDELTCTLYFHNQTIVISKKEESDPHKLMRTLFKDTSKTWAKDEILEDWGYSFDEDVSDKKVYQAGITVNQTIAQETRVKDFLLVSTKNISINPVYLKP